MKLKLFILLSIISLTSLFAQLDRSVQPKPGPAPEIKLSDYESFELQNGLKVFVIENHKLPKVTFSMLTVRDPLFEGSNKGYISIAGDLLRRGTKNRTKDQIDEEIDFIGASLNTSGTSFSGSSLKKHFDKLMEIFSDIILNYDFKTEELDKIKKQILSSLASQKDDPNFISENLRRAIIYGNEHPYGEIMTEESVNSVNLELCKNYADNYLKPNISLLAFVGDITLTEAKSLTEKYFGSWQKKDIPKNKFKSPQTPLIRKVAISDRPSSVQSIINVAYPIDLKENSEDIIKVSVMNNILGGSFSSRLNQNLREDKGYTYGAYSVINPDKFTGYFNAVVKVRNSVTDSTVTEIFNEMNKLRNEKVDEQELKRVKNYLTGTFSQSLERPETIARFALNIERNKLPKDYYKNYLKNLNLVSAKDIQEMAKKYLTPKNSYVIVVGNADEIKSGLKKFSVSGKINYYDVYGKEYDPNLAKVEEGITAESIIENFLNVIGGRERLSAINDKTTKLKGNTQGTDLTLIIYQKAPNKLYQELDFTVGKQITIFDGKKAVIESMGQIQELNDAALEDLKLQASLNAFLNYKENNYKLELAGIENLNGKDAYKIILTPPNNNKHTHYYDKETGYKIREVNSIFTPQGSFTQIIDLDDYREVDGIKNPFKLTQTMGPQQIILEVTSIEFNKNLSDNLFNVNK